MLRKIYIFSLIISVLMLISCNKKSGFPDVHLSGGAISFSPTIGEADWSAVGNKKNTTATKGNFTSVVPSIGVMAFWSTSPFESVISTIQPNLMYNQLLTKDDDTSVWATSTTFYWPMGDNMSSFFAYAPYADATNGITVSTDTDFGIPTVTYEMPTETADQPDLLIANVPLGSNKDVSYTSTPASVKLKFNRALAAIGFSLQGISAEEVSRIRIVNIFDSGTINMSDLGDVPIEQPDPTTPWVSLAKRVPQQPYEIGLIGGGPVTAVKEKTDITAADGYVMIIPQLSTDVYVELMIDGQKKILSFTAGGRWDRGHRYMYNLIVSAGYNITVELIVLEWYGHGAWKPSVDVSDEIKDPPFLHLDGWEPNVDVSDKL